MRLVYAPPRAIGNYGDEIDNFMWPRHAGDFTFLRAYVGKDGKPAAYAKDNVPYRPKSWLTVSQTPLHAGDYVMVNGEYTAQNNLYLEASKPVLVYQTIGGSSSQATRFAAASPCSRPCTRSGSRME